MQKLFKLLFVLLVVFSIAWGVVACSSNLGPIQVEPVKTRNQYFELGEDLLYGDPLCRDDARFLIYKLQANPLDMWEANRKLVEAIRKDHDNAIAAGLPPLKLDGDEVAFRDRRWVFRKVAAPGCRDGQTASAPESAVRKPPTSAVLDDKPVQEVRQKGSIENDAYPASNLLGLTSQLENSSGPELQKQAELNLDVILARLPISPRQKAVFRAKNAPTGLILKDGDYETPRLRVDLDAFGSDPSGSDPSLAARAILIVNGDVELASATNALIIASGDVSISHSGGNVVIAGGNIEISHDGTPDSGSLVVTQGRIQMAHARQSVVYAEQGITVSSVVNVQSFNTPKRDVAHGHINNRAIDEWFKSAEQSIEPECADGCDG